MFGTETLRVAELMVAVSETLDIVSPKLASHQMRAAFVAWQVAEAAGLDAAECRRVFLAALVHDIGAVTSDEKIELHEAETTATEPHCVRGAWLLGQVPWLEPAAAVVRWHHQPWFQTGASVLTTDARASQILQLADTLERAIDRSRGILEQADDIRNGLLRLSGRELHPEIAACIRPVTESEAFWFDLTSPHLPQMLAHDSPLSDVRVDRAGFAALAGLLHRIVDFRSHFTATHSAGVAAAARALAAEMGLTTVEQSELALAGELHDLGKLAVPNGILEKPAALTSGERGVVRQHTYHTYTVLRQVAGMEALAESAAFHHERLDGTGYPFRLKAGALTTPARIMAVADTFTALAEDRPYRRPMEDTAVRNLLGQQVRAGAISREIVAVACDRFGALRSAMAAAQAVSQASYAQLTA